MQLDPTLAVRPRCLQLDVNVLRYLSKEDFRVLTAVEMGQKNVSAPGLLTGAGGGGGGVRGAPLACVGADERSF